MATLEHLQTRERVELTDPTLIGRSRSCHLQLQRGHVSGTHATVLWSGQCWEVRDLGSRNGTFLDGHRLPSGERGALSRGGTLAFGDSEDAWRVVSDDPPAATATCGELRRRAAEGLLALPDEDDPVVCIYRDAAGWWADGGDRSWRVGGGDTVAVGEQVWVLDLPEDLRPTQELPAAGGARLLFRVSQDEEHIELDVETSRGTLTLGHRAHSYLLLTLARARLEDKDTDLPESEEGWVYHDELWQRMNMTEGHFNMLIFRARQQLSNTGIADAQKVIERRRGSRQIRLGLRQLAVERL